MPDANQAPKTEAQRSVRRVRAGAAVETADWLAVEEPLELRVNGKALLVLMRTPGADRALALGFALSEGVAERASHVLEITRPKMDGDHPDNVIELKIEPYRWEDLEDARRAIFASTSCGLCGKTSIASVRLSVPPLETAPTIREDVVVVAPQRLEQAQQLFPLSGGLHAAALLSPTGELLASAEDVGRHNACDKLFGRCADEPGLPWPLQDEILVVSGRASFEIMQKARMVGLGAVLAVSAPSSLAVDFASELNMTLVGFCRGSSYVIYTGTVRP